MKTVLITGASGEIGAAVAREFFRAGYAAALAGSAHFENAERLAGELAAHGGVVCAIRADLSTAAGAEALWDEAVRQLGHIDVLVNGAGVSWVGFYDEMTAAEWDKTLAVNLSAAAHLSRFAAKHMLRRRSGAIVNVSSVWGVSGASLEVAYSAAKAGMIGLTKALALELAPNGVTVNAVAPGFIDTKMNAHLSEEDRAALLADIPMHRAGTVEEVAAAVRFLAESDYITGETLVVSGGWR